MITSAAVFVSVFIVSVALGSRRMDLTDWQWWACTAAVVIANIAGRIA